MSCIGQYPAGLAADVAADAAAVVNIVEAADVVDVPPRPLLLLATTALRRRLLGLEADFHTVDREKAFC